MSEANKETKKISLLEKWNKQMALIQEKTGIRGIYVVIGLVLSVIFVYFNIFDTIITNLVGTLYPAFWTIKSIESDELKEQKNWLTYWAVFGSFILVDMFSPVIIKFIPFYFVMKIMFLIYLLMPGSHGCAIIYNLIVKKILRRYEDKVDNFVSNMGEVFNDPAENKKKTNKLSKYKNSNYKMTDALKAANEIEEQKKHNQ